MIYHITPYSSDKYYGKALNAHIECLPDDSWICVRDMDTMFLTHDAGTMLEQAIIDNPDVDIFTCATNRGFRQKMISNSDMLWHYRQAINRPKKYTEVQGIMAAFLWLFPKRIWLEKPFDEFPIIHKRKSFDARWTLQTDHWKKMRIDHLYIFHYYRLHKNRNNYKHLLS